MKSAIDIGYRHIDSAQLYQNEHCLGEALEEKIKEGKIKREDMFITDKVVYRLQHMYISIIGGTSTKELLMARVKQTPCCVS